MPRATDEYDDPSDFDSGAVKYPSYNRPRYKGWTRFLPQDVFDYWWSTPQGKPLATSLQACLFEWREDES